MYEAIKRVKPSPSHPLPSTCGPLAHSPANPTRLPGYRSGRVESHNLPTRGQAAMLPELYCTVLCWISSWRGAKARAGCLGGIHPLTTPRHATPKRLESIIKLLDHGAPFCTGTRLSQLPGHIQRKRCHKIGCTFYLL